jgi:hypothetical protein
VTTIGIRARAACSTAPREAIPHHSDPHMTDLRSTASLRSQTSQRPNSFLPMYNSGLFLPIKRGAAISTNRRIVSSHHNPQEQCSDRQPIAPTTSSPPSWNRFQLILHPTTVDAPSLHHRHHRHVISLLNYHRHIESPKLKTGICVMHG